MYLIEIKKKKKIQRKSIEENVKKWCLKKINSQKTVLNKMS